MERIDKKKYRYNWKSKKWDELYTFNTDISFVSNIVGPNGERNTYSLPRNSPLTQLLVEKPYLR